MSNARELAELAGSYGAGGFVGMKNRIINGAMMIDQRNAGASTTPSGTTSYNYLTDRWAYNPTQASKMTWGQNLNSVTPPAGYSSYLGGQVGASANVTVGSGDYFFLRQAIEASNIVDLGFGAAGASSITLSFWVRSSLTGTFGGTLENAALNRGYPFTYTISAANTWEQKTITFAGDVTGTWATNNTTGIDVRFGLGAGATYQGTAGSWQAINTVSATGATNLIATNSATFYITGVQLEKGSTATSFDYRPYGTELALCQRYLPAFTGINNWFGTGIGNTSTQGFCTAPFPVTTRVAPTGVTVSSASHFNVTDYISLASAATSITLNTSGTSSALLIVNVASGVTVARPLTLVSVSASANLYFTGCEL